MEQNERILDENIGLKIVPTHRSPCELENPPTHIIQLLGKDTNILLEPNKTNEIIRFIERIKSKQNKLKNRNLRIECLGFTTSVAIHARIELGLDCKVCGDPIEKGDFSLYIGQEHVPKANVSSGGRMDYIGVHHECMEEFVKSFREIKDQPDLVLGDFI